MTDHQLAQVLYIGEASHGTFYELFTKQQLLTLWEEHCIYKLDDDGQLIEPAPYDDEVYEALALHNHWEEL